MGIRKDLLVFGAGVAAVAGTFGYLIAKKNGNNSMKQKESLYKTHETTSDDPLLNYVKQHCTALHPVQTELIAATKAAPKSWMLASSDELQLLQSLVVAMGARKTLDIGTYTGYSALTIALGLPEDGKVVACDIDQGFVQMGKSFWEKAGVNEKIDLRIGPAVQTLDELIQEGESGSFDFAFIDADKENYINYYEKCLKLLRKGGIIAVDNVLWDGYVIDPSKNDSSTVAIRTLNEVIVKDHRVTATMLLLGDGTTVAVKK